jgi:hypothetical protein
METLITTGRWVGLSAVLFGVGLWVVSRRRRASMAPRI